jgi:hypothetical protein
MADAIDLRGKFCDAILESVEHFRTVETTPSATNINFFLYNEDGWPVWRMHLSVIDLMEDKFGFFHPIGINLILFDMVSGNAYPFPTSGLGKEVDTILKNSFIISPIKYDSNFDKGVAWVTESMITLNAIACNAKRCPNCGGAMFPLRFAKNNKEIKGKFGCLGYPDCLGPTKKWVERKKFKENPFFVDF